MSKSIKINMFTFDFLTSVIFLSSLNQTASQVYHIKAQGSNESCTSPCLTLSQFAAHSRIYIYSNTTLVFLPGKHYLTVTMIISNVNKFSMLSNYSNAQFVCENSLYFYSDCRHVHISNIEFTGCGNNAVNNAERFILENVKFTGRDGSGTALEIFNTSAHIISSTFASNAKGTLTPIPRWLLQIAYNVYLLKGQSEARVGGVIRAIHSHISMSQSTFEGNGAELGGVLFVEHSTITISSTNFIENHGGVIYSSNSSITIEGNTLFDMNTAAWWGGVLLSYHSDVRIKESDFDTNTARVGAVIFSKDSNLTITSCVFGNSLAYIEGGVLMSSDCDIAIAASVFYNNTGINYGGVLSSTRDVIMIMGNSTFENSNSFYTAGVAWIAGSIVTIESSGFYENTASENGGVFYVVTDDNQLSLITIETCTFDGNSAISGGVIHTRTSTALTVQDSNFTNNIASIGAVFYSTQSSILKLYGSLLIANNSAIDYGILYLANSYGLFGGHCVFETNNGSLVAFNSYIIFEDNAQFVGNTPHATTGSFKEGGAITLFQSNIYFNGTVTLEHNRSENGGAIHSSESILYVNTNNVTIAHNTATSNGGGMYLSNSELKCNAKSIFILFDNTAFIKGGGIHAIGSSLKVIVTTGNSGIHNGGLLNVTKNTAEKGGGLSLEVNAKLYVLKYNIIPFLSLNAFAAIFVANTAVYGGAVYADDDTNTGACSTYRKSECFFQALAVHSYSNYNLKLVTKDIYFTQNSARYSDSGSTLYGGLLDRCAISPFAEVLYNNNYLEKDGTGLTYLKEITTATNFSISSDPVKVCVCIDNKYINCSQMYELHTRKGQNFMMSMVAINQAGYPVNAIIQSSLNYSESGLGEGQLTRRINGSCTDLSFSVTSPHKHEELTLYASDGPCKDADLSTLSIEIRFLPCDCPIGFKESGSNQTNCTCDCHSSIDPYAKCDLQSESFVRQGQSNVWISYDNTTATAAGYLVYLNCPFDYCKPLILQTPVDLNQPNGADAQCASNRSGLLCGSCQPGLSLSLGSSLCLSCPSYWPALLLSITLAAVLAGIVLVVVLLILNMTVSVGTINGLIFYANVLAANRSILLPFTEPNFITVLVSWLNLELGIDTCFIEGMDTYSKTWIRLAFPTYIICIVAMVITVSSYSTKFSHLIGRKNPVATLATLILLSYAKLIEIVFSALALGNLIHPDGSIQVVWLPDANVNYLKGKHIVMFITAVVILIVGLVFTVLVFSWQWLLHLPQWRVFRWLRNPKLQTFIETYHIPYTARHRYWTGLLLLVRAILYLVAAVNVSNNPQIALTSITFTVGCLLVLKGFFGRIYEKWPVDVLETFFYFNILFISVFTWYSLSDTESNKEAAIYISVTITIIVLLLIILYHMYSHTTLLNETQHKSLERTFSKVFKSGPQPKSKQQLIPPPPDEDIHRFHELLDMIDRPINTNDYNILSSTNQTPNKPTHSVVEISKQPLSSKSNDDDTQTTTLATQ